MPDVVIENPVLNSPFDGPTRHFKFSDDGITDEIVDERRISAYFIPIPPPKKKGKQLAFDTEWTQDRIQENTFINQVRSKVALWRRGGYQGVTKVTRRLLDYWRNPERDKKLFFCQIEAAETAIYITEVANKYGDTWMENHLRQANADANPLLYRIAFKMATGTGKTVVMAMLIAWHALNKKANPQDPRFSDTFLMVTPGITIRDRLRVLLPNDPDNYCRQRDIIPPEDIQEVGKAKIIITNFHAFLLRERFEGARLTKAQALRERVEKALEQVREEEDPRQVNLTDGDARLVKSRQGVVAGYNAQAMVSPLKKEAAGGTGLFITAADVTNNPDDHGQLIPMIEAAQETTGEVAELTLADGGYHSGPVLADCEKRQTKVLMAEAQKQELKGPFHKDCFEYDAQTDSYTCPHGQVLTFRGTSRRQDRPEKRIYGTTGGVCRGCPAFGKCTKEKRQGRRLEIGPYEDELRRHRALMETEKAKSLYSRRKELAEPVFGILKELHGARRFLLRGLLNVRPEWALIATAFNLRTLWRVWQGWAPERRGVLTGVMA